MASSKEYLEFILGQLSELEDSMRPLIEQDIAETEKALILYEKAN